MTKLQWFERQFQFGVPAGMLPFYLTRLEGTIVRLENIVHGIQDQALSHRLDGKWSVKENIGHLAEVDEIALRRIDEMIGGISPMSPAVFEPRGDYNRQPVTEVIQYLRNNRVKNMARYDALDDDELMKASLHPRLKLMMTPVDLAYFDAEHDDHHLVRIQEIIQTLIKP